MNKTFHDLVADADGNVIVPIGPDAVGCDIDVTVSLRRRITQEEWVALLDRAAGSIDDPTFVRPPQCGCEQLSRTSKLDLEGHGRPFRVVVEPWAVGFDVGAADRCTVVARHPEFAPTMAVHPYEDELVVTVQESRSTFVFVRNNVVEFATPESLAIPELAGSAST